jgi:hypothetical protein
MALADLKTVLPVVSRQARPTVADEQVDTVDTCEAVHSAWQLIGIKRNL